MKVESFENLRNVVVVGYNVIGKISFISGLFFSSGVVNWFGKVDDGNIVIDFDFEEIKCGIFIGFVICFVLWWQNKINFIDCFGMGIFFVEMCGGMCIVDFFLFCVYGVVGVQVNIEKVWEFVQEIEQFVVLYFMMMDCENVDFDIVVINLQEQFDWSIVLVQFLIGKEGVFEGVVDLIVYKVYFFDVDGDGKVKVGDIFGDIVDEVNEWCSKLVELVVELDEEFMELYFDNGDFDEEQICWGVQQGMLQCLFFLLMVFVVFYGIGNLVLFDLIVDFCFVLRLLFSMNIVGEDFVDYDGVGLFIFKMFNDLFVGKISFF